MSNISKQIASLSPEKQAFLSQRLRAKKGTATRTSIQRQSRETTLFSTSFAQQRLWLLDQLESGTPTYNICRAFFLSGPLDDKILEHSLNEIVRRHETLRTTFTNVDTQLVQVIAPFVPMSLEPIQLEKVSEDEIKQLVSKEARTPFDLSQGPLLRATLLRLNEEAHVFILTIHHIVSDGWSMEILFRELSTLYDAYTTGKQFSLPELPIQYADYAHWQREWLQGERLATQQAYWKQQLSDLPETLALPTDRPRPAQQTFHGALYPFTLSHQVSDNLKEFSKCEGVTLFMTLLGVFKVLLYRYTGQEDLVLGSPIANRTRAEIEGLIGFFVNTLVLRTRLSADSSFRELLKRVSEVTIDAYAHQDLPFEQLVEMLQPTRSLSCSPLYQVLFDLQNASTSGLKLGNVTGRLLDFERGVAKFDLTLFMLDTEQGLQGILEYNTDLFESSTIRRMATHFQVLAENIVANPDCQIGRLPLLTQTEREQFLVLQNDTQTDYPQEQCVHTLFELQAEQTPNALAVICGEEHLTYDELNRRANRLARYLRQQGAGPEVLIGLCMERSLDQIVGLLGILKAGGAYVPLDSSSPKDRLAFMLADIQVKIVLTVRKLANVIPSHVSTILCLDSEQATIAYYPDDNLPTSASSTHLAYAMYTSGSTGMPKAVGIPHRAIVRLVKNTNFIDINEQEVFFQYAPVSFDASTLEIWGPLLNGARLVIPPPHQLSLQELGAFIQQYQVTSLWLTAGLFHQMVEEQLESFRHLHQLLAGGDVLSPAHVHKVLAAVPICRMINGYGPTENTTFTCTYHVSLDQRDSGSLPIGRPIANTTVYILDRYLQPVPTGVVGELYIGGAGLARGYLNRPELTALRFVPHPFSSEPGARLYRSGDLARHLSNGDIEYLGRIDLMVKIRGFRIELGEIEHMLGQCPAVRECVVLAQEDTTGNKQLVAYVVGNDSYALAHYNLRQYLQEYLPDYMVPSVFIELKSLPLTPNGKVDRRALPPLTTQPSFNKTFVAPRTATEELLTNIWSEILGVEQISTQDNFFELGGHSLRATKVISRIRTVLQIELSVRDLFENPTVAHLATRIEIARKATQAYMIPPLKKVSHDSLSPLSFAQERLWFMDQLEPDGSSANIPCVLRLVGPLDARALETSLQEIVHRHESFRTTFATKGTVPVQVIAAHIDLPFVITDISDHPASEREQASQQLIRREAEQPFDLKQGPMIRAHLLRLALDTHILLITTHHIVADGWSIDIVLRELALLYEAFIREQPSPLPPLPFQYRDYTVWQREWLQGNMLETQLAYWKHYLSEARTALEQFTSYPDRPRPVTPNYRGAWHFFTFSGDLIAKMRHLSRQEDATLFMLLLAAFETLLYRYTQQDDFLLGTPIASRAYAEIEGLVGFFTNMLVLRANFSNNPDFRELLRQTREATLNAYAHQDLPFARLVEALQPRRDPSRNPLFQVMFVFHNEGLRQTPQFSNLTMDMLQVSNGTGKFDLTVSFIEAEEGLQGVLEYTTELFDERFIANMAGHFQTLLENIVEHPEQRVSDLQLLKNPELHQLLANRYPNQAELSYQCLHEYIEAQAAHRPDALAIDYLVPDTATLSLYGQEQTPIRGDGNACTASGITYKELNSRANQLAHYLRRRGIGLEKHIGIYMQQSLELFVGILGILKAGGVVVPLDPSVSPEQLASILDETAISMILTQQCLLRELPRQNMEVILLDGEEQAKMKQESNNNLVNMGFPENTACILYTSGSTGKPKGVLLSHQSLAYYSTTMARDYALEPKDRVLSFASTDCSIVEIFPVLVSGTTAVLSAHQEIIAPTDLPAKVDRNKLTVLTLPASYWHQWVEELPYSHPSVPSSLRLIAVSGGKILPASFRTWQELAGETVQWRTTYGLTEATGISTRYKPEEAKITEETATIPIGQPIDNTQIYILDAHLQLTPIGVPGEIYIGGTGLARGYHHRPELTAECFIPDPFTTEAGARLYRTRDMARYLPDGNLEFLGRLNSRVEIGGFHAQPDEIENVFMNLPEIQEAVVVPWENSRGEQRLVAYMIPRPQQELNLSKLRSQLRTLLPEYMIPTILIELKMIPRTSRGKVSYQALPSPEEESGSTSDKPGVPYNTLERYIAQIWQEVLQLEKVGLYDNFFDLGGHSLLLLQVHDKLSAHLNQAISVIDLFNYPTVSVLAEHISSQQQHTNETTLTGQNRASTRKDARERYRKAKVRP